MRSVITIPLFLLTARLLIIIRLVSSTAFITVPAPGLVPTGKSLRVYGIKLRMQEDCNLVLYRDSYHSGAVSTVRSPRPIWWSGTNGKGTTCVAKIQEDGNLVVYDSDGPTAKAKWASSIYPNDGPYHLILDDNGMLGIYKGDSPIWLASTRN